MDDFSRKIMNTAIRNETLSDDQIDLYCKVIDLTTPEAKLLYRLLLEDQSLITTNNQGTFMVLMKSMVW